MIHNLAAYCRFCLRVQCNCRKASEKPTRHVVGKDIDPSPEEIDATKAELKAARIEDMKASNGGEGERLGKLAYQLPGGTRRRMKVSADY